MAALLFTGLPAVSSQLTYQLAASHVDDSGLTIIRCGPYFTESQHYELVT